MNGRSCLTSPHFLREASPTKSCTAKELFAVFNKAFYYLANEKIHMEAVCDCCELLNKHLILQCKRAKEKFCVIVKLQLQLLTTIACYSAIRKAQTEKFLRFEAHMIDLSNCYCEFIKKTKQLAESISRLKERLRRVCYYENLLLISSKDVPEMFAEYRNVTL